MGLAKIIKRLVEKKLDSLIKGVEDSEAEETVND